MRKTGLKIHTWPDRILIKKCREVKTIDAEISELLTQMYQLMLNLKGIGLAANQVDIDLKLAVVAWEDKVFRLINPSIYKKEGCIRMLEGCLSFPGLELEIKRSKKVWVSALDEKGEPLELEADGVLAVVFQHEIDHLDGITFIKRIPLLKRVRIFAKLKRLKKAAKKS